ncbi:MAG: hypothetical protein Q9227_001051 [Pyrenula ochraceoflavens]
MSAVASSVVPANGVSPHPPTFDEAAEYEKILRICHQISTGAHPRLKLPSQLARVVPSQLSAQPQPKIPPTVNGTSRPSLPGLQPNSPSENDPALKPPTKSKPISSQFMQAKNIPAELDPIFLQKSDHLIQAETKLQRDRLDKQLREQLDQKRTWARHHTSPEEAKPDFDIDEILAKALDLVKPIPIKSSKLDKTPSDSFDEDSLYSSKAPDSTPRGGDATERSPVFGPQVPPLDIDDNDADGPVDHRDDALRQADHADSSVNPYQHSTPQRKRSLNMVQGPPRYAARESDDSDEADYEPPEPAQFAEARRDADTHAQNGPTSGRRYSPGRYSDRYRHGGRRHDSPPSDPRIVRNHITSPIAPQPSRISPLTTAKAPTTSQKRYPQSDHSQRRFIEPESLRTSPEIPPPAVVQSRKRRKLRDDAHRKGQKSKRRAAMSPEPMIKDEPVSPPPFHDVPPLSMQRTLQNRTGPVYIDVDPPPESRYSPAPRTIEYQPRQTVHEVESPADRPRLAPYSRTAVRQTHRDDQDLRRVASLRSMQTEYVSGQPPSTARTDQTYYPQEARLIPRESYPERARSVIYDEPVPAPQRSLVREASPMIHRNQPVYAEDSRSMQLMPPPQRRIVVDEAGNRYYETIAQPQEFSSVAPRRRLEVDENEAISLRNNSMRAASVVVEDPYRGSRQYVQEMPPPQGYRRVTELPRAETVDRRIYPGEEDLERRQIMRSGSVQYVDYPPRQAMYVEDRQGPRDEIVRMSSIRPPPSRYEEPQIQRVRSVRPEAPDFSFVEDRPQLRREFTPMSRPTYEVRRELGGSVYETEDGRRLVFDGGMEGRHSVAPRY